MAIDEEAFSKDYRKQWQKVTGEAPTQVQVRKDFAVAHNAAETFWKGREDLELDIYRDDDGKIHKAFGPKEVARQPEAPAPQNHTPRMRKKFEP